MHPCYDFINATYVFKSNPSIICVLLYVFLGLIAVATVCGNVFVIISIIYFKQLHVPTNFLILSLAVADLLVGLLVFPLSMTFTLTFCLIYENLFCKIRDSLDVSLCTCSILNLCCISVDRYYAVCHPLKYRSVTLNATLIMILVSWAISAIVGGGIIFAGFSQGTCDEVCFVDAVVANTTGPVFSFYLPAIIMVCIYFKIFLVAKRQVHNIKSTSTTVSKMEKKATKTLGIVMGVFLFCMMPNFFCIVSQPFIDNPPSLPAIETLNWLTLSNSMLNPFIYAFFYSWFRKAFRMIISGKIFHSDCPRSRLISSM